ncbi:MAG: hypothetical protein EBT15_11515 [Betaproteobacteria bacterium]|nr:hypothetical protein [Betaproteobacteria bacterium]
MDEHESNALRSASEWPSLKEYINHVQRQADVDIKATNPKDAVGIRKAPLSTVPSGVMAEVGVAMLEPETLPPRFKIPGSNRVMWLEADVLAWIEEQRKKR